EQRSEVFVEDRARRPGRDVGTGRDRDRNAGLVEEVAERRALEQDLVVVVRRELRAPGAAADELPPVEGVQPACEQRALDVALEEPLLVLGEQPLAVDPLS